VILGHAIVQAVSHHPVTVEARVQTRVSLCGICSGQGVTRKAPKVECHGNLITCNLTGNCHFLYHF
jgi:hypothetical protein